MPERMYLATEPRFVDVELSKLTALSSDAQDDASAELLVEWLNKTLSELELEIMSHRRLCWRLTSDWHALDDSVVLSSTELVNSLKQLDFKLLVRHGWIARVVGRDKRASFRFRQQWNKVKASEGYFNATSLVFVQTHMAQRRKTTRAVLELELEGARIKEMLVFSQSCIEALSIALADDENAFLLQVVRRMEMR